MTTSLDPAALRGARQRKGLTQGQVAQALGLAGPMAVSVWERGANEPKSAAMLGKLAAVLDVTVPELLRLDEGKKDLRYVRLAAGLESAEVANRLHVAVSTYRRWERGAWTRSLGDVVLADLASAFGVSASIVAGALAHSKVLGNRDHT